MIRLFTLVSVMVLAAILAGCKSEPAPEPNPPNTNAVKAPAANPPAKTDPAAQDDPAAQSDGAPEIQAGYWLNTDPLNLEKLRGKIVVLEFWATWCPPCRTTIPHLNEMYGTYKDKGVAFISLTDEPREKVEAFAKEMKMAYPLGGGSQTGRAYNVRSIPHAFIIDPSGEVVWHGHPMMGLDEALQKQLQATPPK